MKQMRDKRTMAVMGMVAVALLLVGFALGRGCRGPGMVAPAPRVAEQVSTEPAPGGPGEEREVVWEVPPSAAARIDLADPRGVPECVTMTHWVRLGDVWGEKVGLPWDEGHARKWVPDATADAVLVFRLPADVIPGDTLVYTLRATLEGPGDYVLADVSLDGGSTWKASGTHTVVVDLRTPVRADQVLIRWTLPASIARGWTAWDTWLLSGAYAIPLKVNTGWQIPQPVGFTRPVGVIDVIDWQVPRIPGLVLKAVGAADWEYVELRMAVPGEVRETSIPLPGRFTDVTLVLLHGGDEPRPAEYEPYPEAGRVAVRVRGR
ncbi:MAG: hypothetical protein AB1816_16220 [Bacillota bacterium]